MFVIDETTNFFTSLTATVWVDNKRRVSLSFLKRTQLLFGGDFPGKN